MSQTTGDGDTPAKAKLIHKPTGDEVAHDLIWTIPNAITFARLLCIPVFLWLLFGREDRFLAALLFGALGATDWVDGYLARRLDQGSKLGKLLDPTVDRLLFLVGGMAMIIDGAVPLWFFVAVLTREILVSVAALFLAARGVTDLDVTWWGKTATFGMLFALPVFLATSGGEWFDLASFGRVLAWGIGVPSLILSWYTLAEYLPLARAALARK